jgi:hypothetical protein
MLERLHCKPYWTRGREKNAGVGFERERWGGGGGENCMDLNQGFAADFAGAGAGAAAVPPPPPSDDEGRPKMSLPMFSPASLLLSISTPTKCVLEPSQSTLLTPASQPPRMRVHRSLYASATRRCAREPSPSECHSSGVTQVMSVECTA